MKVHIASIVFAIALLLNATCWGLLHAFLRRVPSPWRAALRIALGCFIAGEMLGLCWLYLPRLLAHSVTSMPGQLLPILIYLWNLLTLPLLVAFLLGAAVIRWTYKGILYLRARRAETPLPQAPADLGRRQFLFRTGAALLPAVSTLGMTVAAYLQLPLLRTRRTEVSIPDLPPELDGLRIVHASDFHIGRFVGSEQLRRFVDTVNSLDADLIAFTGDLIDFSLVSMPEGIAALKEMRSRYGLWICEGNHDLYDDPDAFRETARASGLNFLFDESRRIEVRGVPVEVIGLRWNMASPGTPVHLAWQADAFPILLAHHPHQFDSAIAAGIPLTLAGHTHGGQIMFTEHIGCGPLFFRYWSGLYEHENYRLVVSNGAGNWFPLRINAPAEIGLVTLRRV